MSEQITVGYDGTDSSTEAVMWAAQEATVRGAPMRIVSCYEVPIWGEYMVGWSSADAIGWLVEAATAGLEGVRAAVAAVHPQLPITTTVSASPAWAALVSGVECHDLVVVGSSSHGGAAAFWLGSTPRQVVRHSPCPVVVVRGSASRGLPDRIVAGIDGSPAADDALRWAADEADRHQICLAVVHGWSYPYLDTGASQARDLTQIDAECVLDRAVQLGRELCAADVTGVLVEGSPAAALLGSVRPGDLLVLGSHGRGALAASVFGSTVNHVVEHCEVPVAVVHSVVETT